MGKIILLFLIIFSFFFSSLSKVFAAAPIDYMEYSSDTAAQTAYVTTASLDAYVKLLLHMDGSNGSQTFLDSSASNHTMLAEHHTQQSTAQKKFGTASAQYDGIDDYMTTSYDSDFDFGSGDFTIDFWVYFNVVNTADFFTIRNGSDYAIEAYYYKPQNTTNYYINNGTYIGSTSNNSYFDPYTWYHMAFVRNGDNWKVYQNGVETNTGTSSATINNNGATVFIGSLDIRFPNMYIDEFRVSKGIARWTSSPFTPPASSYAPPLQSYSESSITREGSYSLRGVASATDSLNKTLTRTISPTIDLSNKTQIKFDIRAARTGSNIQVSIHDSGGTTTSITPDIALANTWQTVSWDISGLANADKDAIDKIIITITNADADNTFYIDNMYESSASKRIIIVD